MSLPCSDKSYGATEKAKHHIRLKPETKLVYILAYRFPHSQMQIVEEQIKDKLKQGITQLSRSSWNSYLFLLTKRMDNLGMS